MNKMTYEKRNNIFGALKLIEQLYLDGKISEFVFRNIIKEYGGMISEATFNCYIDISPPSGR